MGVDLFGRPSTADTGKRQDFDLYETPAWMTLSLLAHQPIAMTARIFEPCAGGKAIVRVLHAAGYRNLLTNDIDVRHEVDLHADATDLDFWSHSALASVDWVITNPTFLHALPILEQAERLARVGVAMLLRKTFLEPTGREDKPKPADRGPWLSVHPPTRCIGLPRHKFRGAGSDSVSCDWMIWERLPDRSLTPFVIDYQAKNRRLA